MRILSILSLLMCISAQSALATDLVTQPESSVLVSSQSSPTTVINKLGDTSVANPSWVIQMPSGTAPFASSSDANYGSAPGTSWQALAGIGRVQYHSTADSGFLPNTYELALNAQTNASPCGQELDLFFMALQPGGYKDLNNNVVPARVAQSTTLDRVSTVNLQLGLTIPYENISSTKCVGASPNNINAASYLAEVSARSTNGQFIFYQVHFRETGSSSAYNVACPGFSPPIYCFDSDAGQLGGPSNQSVGSTRVFYNLNLLGGIENAISRTTDGNIANWHIEAAYFGPSLEGGISTTSEWDSFKLSVY